MSDKLIVADTGPLIALAHIDLLNVLTDLFDAVYITNGVLHEATFDTAKPGAKKIKASIDSGQIILSSCLKERLFNEVSMVLDLGEAESLCLAHEINALALVDEKKDRKVGKNKGIKVTGTAAILIKAKQQGLIPQVKPYLIQLNKFGYRLSDNLISMILLKCDER